MEYNVKTDILQGYEDVDYTGPAYNKNASSCQYRNGLSGSVLEYFFNICGNIKSLRTCMLF
jgi:hypothetical protein